MYRSGDPHVAEAVADAVSELAARNLVVQADDGSSGLGLGGLGGGGHGSRWVLGVRKRLA